MTAAKGNAGAANGSKDARRNKRKKQPATSGDHNDGTSPLPEVHWLGDIEFRQYPSGVYGVQRDDDGELIKPYPILPGRLDVDRVIDIADIERDGSPGDVSDTLWHVTYAPPDARARSAAISDANTREREPEWPTKLTIGSRVGSRKLDPVLNAIKAISTTAGRDGRREEGYSATGLLHRPGEAPVFLRQGLPALTPDGVDRRAFSELQGGIGDESGVRALTLDDPSSSEGFGDDLLALLDLVSVLPEQPYIPMALLGQLCWAPWSSDDELGRFATIIAGETGLRKTTMLGLFIAAQSRTFSGGDGIEVPVTVPARHGSSSAIGTDRFLYPLRGMLAVVDDLFAGKQTGKEIAAGWTYLSQVANNATTGAGGAKGARVGNAVRASRYPRGCPAFTAEELPDEDQHASEVNRTAAFKLETALDLEALTRSQQQARALSRAHAGMIQRGLSDMEAPRRALAWASAEVREWNVAGHNRARGIYSKIMAGLKLFGDHLHEQVEIDPAPLLAEWSEVLAEGAEQQAHRCGMSHGVQDARDHVRLFCKHFLDLVGREVWLADKTKVAPDRQFNPHGEPTFQPAEIDGFSPGAQGWRQAGAGWQAAVAGEPAGAVHIASGFGRPPWREIELRMRLRDFSALYERITAISEWPMPSEQTMRAKLVNAGFLQSGAPQKKPLWTNSTWAKVLTLDLGSILGVESDQDDDSGGKGGGGDDAPEPTGPDPESTASPEPEPELFEHGACAQCGEAMVLLHPEQQAHPLCSPEEAPATGTGTDEAAATSSPEPEAEPEPVPAEHVPAESGGRGFGVIGVLDDQGLSVSTGEMHPVDVPVVGTRGALYELAEAHGVGQLWVHPSASDQWGVPRERPADLAKDAGMPHPVAEIGNDGPDGITGADPYGGIGPWNVVWRAGDRRGTSRSIVLVAQDDRMPWAAAESGAVLLDAVTRLNAALGSDFYWSPAATIRQFVGKHTYSAKPNLAIQRGGVPPAVVQHEGGPAAVHRQMIRGKWARALTDVESAANHVHRIDLSAAELAGLSVAVGNEEAPEHWTGPIALTFARKRRERSWAGYWRVAEAPVADELLPRFRCEPGPDGGLWLTTPDVVLLADLGKLPKIEEAYVWPRSVRALDATGKALREARKALLAQRADAAGELAHQALKPMYTHLIGNLARTAGPAGEEDGLWRPDWRDMIQAQTYANMYRKLVKAGEQSGQYPVAMNADAVYFVTYEHRPRIAIPDAIAFGDAGGQWKHEGCVSLPSVQEYAESNRWFLAFDAELERVSA